MIKVKHLMDEVEADDGQRIWIEPIGLCLDLRQWCHVHAALPALSPPRQLWDWHQRHPHWWRLYRRAYHNHLAESGLEEVLRQFALHGASTNFTFLHQGDDRQHNTATALADFIMRLAVDAESPPPGNG